MTNSKQRTFVSSMHVYGDKDLDYLTRAFSVALSAAHYQRKFGRGLAEDRTKKTNWLPWAWGGPLQEFWLACRDRVREKVSALAFDFMDQRFNSEDARQPESWSLEDRSEMFVRLGLAKTWISADNPREQFEKDWLRR